jgi:hypothetical protein
LCRQPCDFGPLFRGELDSSRFAAFRTPNLAARNPAGAFPLFFWRRRPVLDLPTRDIDHELGELGGIAGAFEVLSRHRGSHHSAFSADCGNQLSLDDAATATHEAQCKIAGCRSLDDWNAVEAPASLRYGEAMVPTFIDRDA